MPIKLIKRGAIWHARGTIAGQRVRESTQCSKRRDAESWAIRREAEIIQSHAHGAAASLTFAQAALTYMQTGGEGRFLGPILDHLGPGALVADLDNAAVQAAALALYPGRAPATINRQVIGPISAVITMAAENGLATPRRFRRLKAAGQRTRWLDPAEVERLMAAAPAHLVPILAFLVGSGARTGEAVAARVENWHPATGEVWLPETKNGHPRMVRMPARARDLVLAAAPAAGPLFLTPKGVGYVARANGGGQIEAAFKRARVAAGLGPEVTPHVLRHTWATWYYAATRDFGGLLDLGGWRTTSTAERYRKIAPADLDRRLVAHGWDFAQLGADLPAVPRPALRLIT